MCSGSFGIQSLSFLASPVPIPRSASRSFPLLSPTRPVRSSRRSRPGQPSRVRLPFATAAVPTPAADPESADEGGFGEGEKGSDNAESPAEEPEPGSGVQGIIDAVSELVNDGFEKLVWPFVGSCSVLREQWERSGGNFILRPPGRPKAVVHFVGGAFVGAAPHIAYSTLLSRLARRGYCVVATPFDLSLNYLETTGKILEKWEAVETGLALDYGPIPVVGVGHSAGALFHALASSLFDDVSPKAALVLISFNNKPIKSAIPAYDALVTPVAKQAVSLDENIPENVRETLESLPETIDSAVEGSPFAPERLKHSVLPILKDARRVAEQFSPLVGELAGRARPDAAPESAYSDRGENAPPSPLTEFYPPPADVQVAISHMYCVEQTLVVKFNSDSIDESESVLNSVRKRGETSEVSMMELNGNHLTPLVQDLPDPTSIDTSGVGVDLGPLYVAFSGAVEAVSAFSTRELYNLESLVDEWVEATVLSSE